jgi:hypothetical protein
MQYADRDGFIVRILRSATPDRAAGIGFVVGDQHIVTCAHVINTALGRDKTAQDDPGAGERIQIDFPILGDAEGAPTRTCRVARWLPPPKSGVSGGDVAGLVVVGEGLPDRAGPARLISDDRVRGAEVQVFGYPADHPDRRSGAWVTQRLRSAVGGGIVQLDTDTDSAMRAQPGYSGSPVVAVDKDGDAVAGMLAIAGDVDSSDAYAIPVTQIAAAWPDGLGKPDEIGHPFTGPVTATPSPEQVGPPAQPQPGLQQPALPQVIAGNWVIDFQVPQGPPGRLMLALAILPFGQLQFQGSFVGTPVPMAVDGLWRVMGNQVQLSGRRTVAGLFPQQFPYEVIVTFASWSYGELIGSSSDGASVIWRRQN